MANTNASLRPRDSHCSNIPPPSPERSHARVGLRRSFDTNRPRTQSEVHAVSEAALPEHDLLRQETSHLLRALCAVFSPILEIFQTCVNLLAESHLSLDKVHQISIVAIMLHISLHELAHFLPHAHPPNVMFQWILPVLASVACLSGIIMLWMKCYPSQLVVACAITTLFAVECLLPIAIAGCTVLCIGNFVSLSELILVSGCLLGFCSFTSWGIRQVLYPSLSLG